jgi:PAS domain S-box-containing protein
MPNQPAWLHDLGNTANGVFTVDQSQRILTWNNAAEKLLGHRPEEVIGRHCYEVVGGRLPSGEPQCRPACKVQQCAGRGEVLQDFDFVATTATGDDVRATLSVTTIAAKTGPLVLHVLRQARRPDRGEEVMDDILSRLKAYRLLQRMHTPDDVQRCCDATLAPAADLSVFSLRELEVFDLLTRGCSTANMASQLNISVLTVRSHVRNMLRKTEHHSRAQLVSAAMRGGGARIDTD